MHASVLRPRDVGLAPGGPPWASITDRNGADHAVKPANRRADLGVAGPAVRRTRAPAMSCWPTRAGRSSRSSRARRPGTARRSPVRVTGPRHGDALGDDDADRAAPLAFEADRLVGQLRSAPDGHERDEELEKLAREIGQPRSSASTAT